MIKITEQFLKVKESKIWYIFFLFFDDAMIHSEESRKKNPIFFVCCQWQIRFQVGDRVRSSVELDCDKSKIFIPKNPKS